MCMNTYSCYIHNSQKLETIPVSINMWNYKQVVKQLVECQHQKIMNSWYTQYGKISKTLCWAKKKKNTRIHSLWLNLCKVQKQAKPTCNNKWVRWWRDCVVAQKDFWGVKYSPPSLWWWLSYMGMYICQNLLKSFNQMILHNITLHLNRILIKRFSFLKETVVQLGKLDWKWEGTLIITHKSEGHWVPFITLHTWSLELRGRVSSQYTFQREPIPGSGRKGRIWGMGKSLGSPRTDSHSGVEMWMASTVVMQTTVVNSDEVNMGKIE